MNPNFPAEANCPSCGRFIGPVEHCAYCGASVKHRLSLRALKYGSLAVAAAGVLLLYLAARGIEPPVVKVRDLQPGMNRAFVRIEGRVEGTPRTLDSGTVMFTLDDGTGKLTVFVDDEVAKELQAADKLPTNNAGVSVRGYLVYRKDKRWSINLNTPEHLSCSEGETRTKRVPIRKISKDMLGDQVEVEGKLEKVVRLRKGVIVFTLEDEGRSIDVKVMEESCGAVVAELEASGRGTKVLIRATVREYKGRLQLEPGGPADIVIVR